MADTRTNRPQATFKHQRFADPEFSILIREAAKRQGMQIGQWVAETLEAKALSILKDEPAEGAALPARPLPDLVAQLVEMQVAMQADQAATAAQLAALRRGRWRKR